MKHGFRKRKTSEINLSSILQGCIQLDRKITECIRSKLDLIGKVTNYRNNWKSHLEWLDYSRFPHRFWNNWGLIKTY